MHALDTIESDAGLKHYNFFNLDLLIFYIPSV